MDIEFEMDEAAATISDVSEKRLTAKQQAMSRVLYLLLMQNCPLGFSCLRVLPRGEGFRAWQELCRKFEPKHPGRYAQQLTDLLNPAWATTAGSFMDKLRRWQFEVREYEAETGENITDRNYQVCCGIAMGTIGGARHPASFCCLCSR